jgi:hypothetical protein
MNGESIVKKLEREKKTDKQIIELNLELFYYKLKIKRL